MSKSLDDKPRKLAVSVAEAAEMIGVSVRTIQNYIQCNELPARKLGDRTVITIAALEQFLQSDHASPHINGEKKAEWPLKA